MWSARLSQSDVDFEESLDHESGDVDSKKNLGIPPFAGTPCN